MRKIIVLEMIHHFVECLDRYFGNVCELDIIFNFHKAYYIWKKFYQQAISKNLVKLYVILKI